MKKILSIFSMLILSLNVFAATNKNQKIEKFKQGKEFTRFYIGHYPFLKEEILKNHIQNQKPLLTRYKLWSFDPLTINDRALKLKKDLEETIESKKKSINKIRDTALDNVEKNSLEKVENPVKYFPVRQVASQGLFYIVGDDDEGIILHWAAIHEDVLKAYPGMKNISDMTYFLFDQKPVKAERDGNWTYRTAIGGSKTIPKFIYKLRKIKSESDKAKEREQIELQYAQDMEKLDKMQKKLESEINNFDIKLQSVKTDIEKNYFTLEDYFIKFKIKYDKKLFNQNEFDLMQKQYIENSEQYVREINSEYTSLYEKIQAYKRD